MPRVDIGDLHLNYAEAGEGDVFFFVPGLIGLTKSWEFQFPHFSKKYRCISFDHRGAGESDKPEEGYSTAQIARDIIGLFDALGIERAHVAGASTGGCILQNLCLDYPERVRCAVFTNTWTVVDEYYGRIQRLRKQLVLECGVETYIQASSIWTGGVTMFRNHFERIAEMEARQRETIAPPDILVKRIDMTLEHDRLADLPKIGQKALIVTAKDDVLTPPYFAEALHGIIKGSELHQLDEGGHNSYRRNPEGWNAAVEAFLEKNRDAA